MPEKKVKPAAKKASTAKVSDKATGKAKTTKATPAAKSKMAPVKKATGTAAKKPGKAAAKSVAKKPPVTKTKPTSRKNVSKLTPEERYRMVETTAYFIAERHGFQGRSDEHWAAAELEVAAKLGQ